MVKRYTSFVLILLSALALRANGQAINGQLDLEGRVFPDERLFDDQHGSNGSIALEAEAFWQSPDRKHELVLTPYVRLDASDTKRNLVDLREGYWQYVARSWEARVGFATVFWGVSESQHLVDIINQTDQSDRPDGESKLGQPMVHFTYVSEFGDIELFGMPFFRERTFPGEDGRLRFPFAIPTSRKLQSERFDVAARWSRPVRWFDVGVSHFWGTTREPTFDLVAADSLSAPMVVPVYETIHQTGVDVQATFLGWLLKLEAISRSGQGDRFYATTGGFEYTFSNVSDSGTDVGVLAEYHFDSRDPIQLGPQEIQPNPFNNDLFVGSRLAFNDVNSTDLLVGGVVDIDNAGVALFLEGSRRLRNSFRLTAEVRAFLNTDATDPLHNFRNDSYGQVTLSYFFNVGR